MATITTLLDGISALLFRTTINDNFTSLNTDKAEQSTTYTKVETDTFNPDFYQYSISRTVSGGNLTVSLKNYEGNDPTPTKPVKYKDANGVVRTITSGVYTSNFTINAGTNHMNAGSAELATKEIDYFVYLGYSTALSGDCLIVSRIPSATVISDFSSTGTNEKYGFYYANFNSTDKVVNIGRFNATLSAGLAWSIPSTSVIVNRPIYESRWLDSDTTLSSGGGMTVTNKVVNHFKYKIVGDNLFYKNNIKMDFGGTGLNYFYETLPFGRSLTDNYDIAGVGFGYDNNDIAPSVVFESTDTSKLRIIKLSTTYALVANANIRVMGSYKI